MDTSWNVTIKTSSLPAYCQVIVVYDDLQFHRFATGSAVIVQLFFTFIPLVDDPMNDHVICFDQWVLQAPVI